MKKLSYEESVYLRCYGSAARFILADIETGGKDRAEVWTRNMIRYWTKDSDHRRAKVNDAFVDARLDAFGL